MELKTSILIPAGVDRETGPTGSFDSSFPLSADVCVFGKFQLCDIVPSVSPISRVYFLTLRAEVEEGE